MQIPCDTIINDKEVLTEKYNHWRDELLSRLAVWKQAELEKKRDAGEIFTNQNGQRLTISEVVEACKGLVREAVQYVQVLKELLDAAEAGTLENYWNEEKLQEAWQGGSRPTLLLLPRRAADDYRRGHERNTEASDRPQFAAEVQNLRTTAQAATLL